MSTDSSANNCPIEDRFKPFRDAEDDLYREIALCSDSDKKEGLTWKLATFYLETARPEKATTYLQLIAETTQNYESKQDSLRVLQFLYGPSENGILASHNRLDLPRVLCHMANVFLGNGKQQPGVLCLLRLLDISSNQEQLAECLLLLGVEYEKAEEYDAAAKLYRRGIECGSREDNTRYFLHNNLGFCLNLLGRHSEAESMCRAAIGIDPQKHNAYKNFGVALQGQGKYAEAAACFLRAALMFPPDYRSIAHLQELLSNHREDVEREIPEIDEHIANVVDVREKLIQ